MYDAIWHHQASMSQWKENVSALIQISPKFNLRILIDDIHWVIPNFVYADVF